MRLSVRSLSKSYGSLRAVDDFSFDVAPGEVLGLLGPNGAGKTTTIRAVVGLLEPDAGSILVDGVARADAREEAARRIGYLPDRPYLPPRLTGREYLEYVAGLWSVPRDVAAPRIEAHLRRFGLAGAADRLASGYSHGMKQRLALGALFVADPPLLVVDEPMVGLDAVAQALVRRALREEASRGKGVLLTTHTLPVAEATCDRILVLHQGKTVAAGTPAEIAAAKGGLEELFLELAGE